MNTRYSRASALSRWLPLGSAGRSPRAIASACTAGRSPAWCVISHRMRASSLSRTTALRRRRSPSSWCAKATGRAARGARAIAIERDPERARRIRLNADALGVPELDIIEGRAPKALDGLEAPFAIFVGGGIAAPGLVERCWEALLPGGVLVANS